MEEKKSNIMDRTESYLNHVAHLSNGLPIKTQYLNLSHSVAWTFSKEKKCK